MLRHTSSGYSGLELWVDCSYSPAASCTGVFLRALILTDMACAALVYRGVLSTSVMASPKAGVPICVGLTRTPNPYTAPFHLLWSLLLIIDTNNLQRTSPIVLCGMCAGSGSSVGM